MAVYDVAAARRELAAEAPPLVELDLDGTVFPVLQTELWGDAAFEVATTGDLVAAARAMMGDSVYESYREAGGTAMDVMRAVAFAQGVEVPESSASTDS